MGIGTTSSARCVVQTKLQHKPSYVYVLSKVCSRFVCRKANKERISLRCVKHLATPEHIYDRRLGLHLTVLSSEPCASNLNPPICHLQNGTKGDCRSPSKGKGLCQHGQQLPSEYWQGQPRNGLGQPLEEEVLLSAVLDRQVLQKCNCVHQLVFQDAAFC